MPPLTELDRLRALEFAYHVLVVARIRNEMQHEGMQQKELAGRIGRSPSFVSELLRGQQGLDVATALLIDRELRTKSHVPITAPPSSLNAYDEAIFEYAREQYLLVRTQSGEARPNIKALIDRFDVDFKIGPTSRDRR